MSHQLHQDYDTDNVFDGLSSVFTTRCNQNQTLEIEILPSSLGLGPLVHDGCSIGITKKALVQAFVKARQVFLKAQDSQDAQLYGDENIIRSSEILLLFAPEHITACNWRKRRLIWILRSTSTSEGTRIDDAHRQNIDISVELDRELTLMTSFLCSPLHRHTKSPSLWQHRFWVLRQILDFGSWNSSGGVQSVLQSELSIVLRAGELHPRNYYAFSYMRQLHAFFFPLPPTPPGVKTKIESNEETSAILDQTISWCLAHPRDISGWMFLEDMSNKQDVQARTVNKVIRFALDIGWTGESLWTFVDIAARRVGIVDGDLGSLARVLGGEEPLKTSWKTWLARAETYWADGHR